MPIYTGKLSGSGDANIVGNTFIEGNLNVSGTLSGITTLSGSGAVSSGAGGTFAGTLNLQDAGITNAGSIAGATTVAASTSVLTPLIEYTDGDDAITIADGGGVTFSSTVKLVDDKALTFGSNDDWTIEYDEDGDDDLVMTGTTFEMATDTVTFTSANATDPLIIIKNTTNDTGCARLRFVKDKGAAGAANDDVGIIQFYGDDANQDQVLFGRIRTRVAVHTDGQEGGKMQFAVASHDGELVAGLTIGDGDAEDEVDVTIGSGASSLVTMPGNVLIAGTTHLSSSGAEALRIGKADADSREIVFESEGVDKVSMYMNSAEHFFIRQEISANDIILRMNTTNVLQLDGSETQVNIAWPIDLQSAGITSAGSIAGATTVSGSAAGSFGSLTVDGAVNLQSAGITNVGSIAGATDLTSTGDMSVTADTVTFTSANSTDPLVIIKNTTNDANGARLRFVKDKGTAGADGDDIGTIEFYGDDAAQTQTVFAAIVAEVSEADNTDEAGKLTLYVAESDGTNTALAAGLILEGEHATDGEVDVTIGGGASSTTTIVGTSQFNGNATFGVDDTGVDVRLYSATASEGVLYDASEDELALLLTTKLKFHDVGGGEEIYASSNGHLEVNAGTTLDITAPTVDINASTEVTIDTDTVTIGSSNSTDPLVVIKNTTNDANSARLRFVKDKGAAGADNDVVGMIEFVGDDDAQDQVLFGRIAVQVVDASNGAEGGGLSLSVATHDGEMQNGLVLTDGDAEDEIDATIGGGAASLTTVAGNLSVTTNSFVAGYTHYDSTPADAITSGVTATFTAGEDLEIGECAYFKSDGKMWKAVATAAATTACVAMAAADISADATGVFLLKGFLRADTNFPTWTVGGRLYTPEAETSGHNVPEQAAPDTDGDFVQVIGWAVDGNTVYFCPDSTIIEVA